MTERTRQSETDAFTASMPFRRLLACAAPSLLFVLAIHGVALSDLAPTSIAVLCAVCFLNGALSAIVGLGRRAVAAWLALAVAVAALRFGLSQGATALGKVVLLPPILANGLMFVVFARTLLPGREALIQKMGRLEVGELAPDFVAYMRGLTWIWALFFALTFLASIILALRADLAIWSWSVNFGVPFLAMLLFLLEHGYRARRFGARTPNSPLVTLRAALRPSAWIADA